MKKILLVLVLVCLLFTLAGCGCKHEETKLINAKDATCSTDGYTGDTVCAKCNEVVIQGQVITAKGHVFSELMGAKDATCTREGYSGDIYCTVCTETVKPGEVVPMLPHIPGERSNVYDATCYSEGYTGDVYCTVCRTRVEEGEAIPTIEHTPAAERSYVREPSCERDGYTGDILCTVCSEVLEEGEAIPMTGHTAGEPYNPYEPTCTWDGYTGTIYCAVCGDWMEDGETIPALGHTAGEPQDGYEPTCTKEGYTGTIRCSVCNDWMENGEYIPVIEHTLGEPLNFVQVTCLADGFTGDRVCSVCEKTVKGEVVPKMEHTFDENNVCTACEWMVPGLYIDGKLQFDWDQLVANNYVTVDAERNRLTGVVKSLYGHLVVAEGLECYSDYLFKECSLNSVYLPESITRIPYAAFEKSSALESVRIFGDIKYIDSYAFKNCPMLKEFIVDGTYEEIGYQAFLYSGALETITLPEGLKTIGESGLEATALSSVQLPSTLTQLGTYAFYDCANLTELVIPESVTKIGDNFITHTGITELVLPASVTRFGHQEETALVSVDMSKAAITDIEGQTFKNNPALETLILPEGLTKLSDAAIINCSAMKRLELPASLVEIYDGWSGDFTGCTSLTTVVWPAGLTDGTHLQTLPNLKNILYRGSELQWNLTVSKDLFAGKTVIFDYVPEG